MGSEMCIRDRLESGENNERTNEHDGVSFPKCVARSNGCNRMGFII